MKFSLAYINAAIWVIPFTVQNYTVLADTLNRTRSGLPERKPGGGFRQIQKRAATVPGFPVGPLLLIPSLSFLIDKASENFHAFQRDFIHHDSQHHF